MLWPIGINVMVGDSFCGRWPRDSWGHVCLPGGCAGHNVKEQCDGGTCACLEAALGTM